MKGLIRCDRIDASVGSSVAFESLLVTKHVYIELALAVCAVVSWLLRSIWDVEAKIDAHDGVEDHDHQLGQEIENVEGGLGEVPWCCVGLTLVIEDRDFWQPPCDGTEALTESQDEAAYEENSDSVPQTAGTELFCSSAGYDEGY